MNKFYWFLTKAGLLKYSHATRLEDNSINQIFVFDICRTYPFILFHIFWILGITWIAPDALRIIRVDNPTILEAIIVFWFMLSVLIASCIAWFTFLYDLYMIIENAFTSWGIGRKLCKLIKFEVQAKVKNKETL